MSFIKENEGKVRCSGKVSDPSRAKILVEVVVNPTSKSGKDLVYMGRRSRRTMQGPLRHAE
jgi:hypothetical protein